MAPSNEWGQARYDAAWKQFFALSVAVEHLLRGFFPDVAALLDFGSLRDVSAEWVFDGDRRLADAVWRADYADGSGRSLLIPVEHQSTVDRAMARRVLRNAGMAFERLRRDRALDGDGRLRLLCVVLHAGAERWTAPGAAERIEVDADGEVLALLAAPYASLDARRLHGEHLPERNLVSTLFELNGATTMAGVGAALRALGGWLPDLGEDAEPARAAYSEWLFTTMPGRFSRQRADEAVEELTNAKTGEEKAMTMTALSEQWLREQRENRLAGQQEERVKVLASHRARLREMAVRKFDAATADELAHRLESVTDPVRLLDTSGAIGESKTSAELLDRVG